SGTATRGSRSRSPSGTAPRGFPFKSLKQRRRYEAAAATAATSPRLTSVERGPFVISGLLRGSRWLHFRLHPARAAVLGVWVLSCGFSGREGGARTRDPRIMSP